MSLYLEITYFSIFVLGMEHINPSNNLISSKSKSVKSTDFSNLKFTVDQNSLFNDEVQIICDSFNIICSLNNIHLLEYCAKMINTGIKSHRSLIKDFDKNMDEFSKKNSIELKILKKILNETEINISDIIETIKKRHNDYTFKSIDSCIEMIKYRSGLQNDTYKDELKIWRNYIKSISEINQLIATFELKAEDGCGIEIIDRINAFIKEYHLDKKINETLPSMDAYTYNNYMLLSTIIRLNSAMIILPSDNKNLNHYNDNNYMNINNLIKNLSVETFMLLAQNDKNIIDQMKENITIPKIKFWNECHLSDVFNPYDILYIDYNNLLQELNGKLHNSIEDFTLEDLNRYGETLKRLRETVNIIIWKNNFSGVMVIKKSDCLTEDQLIDLMKYEYKDLGKEIDDAKEKVDNAIKKLNLNK